MRLFEAGTIMILVIVSHLNGTVLVTNTVKPTFLAIEDTVQFCQKIVDRTDADVNKAFVEQKSEFRQKSTCKLETSPLRFLKGSKFGSLEKPKGDWSLWSSVHDENGKSYN